MMMVFPFPNNSCELDNILNILQREYRGDFTLESAQRNTLGNESCQKTNKKRKNRTDRDPGPHFTNLGCVTVHVGCTRTKQQLHSGLEGISGLQVLSYSTPSGAVSAL